MFWENISGKIEPLQQLESEQCFSILKKNFEKKEWLLKIF